MGSIKAISAIFLSAVILFCTALHSLTASADGERSALPADAEAEEQPAFDLEGCKAAAVYECSSGVLLSGKNEKQLFPAGHFSKLMTALFAAEKIQQSAMTRIVSRKAKPILLCMVIPPWRCFGNRIILRPLDEAGHTVGCSFRTCPGTLSSRSSEAVPASALSCGL